MSALAFGQQKAVYGMANERGHSEVKQVSFMPIMVSCLTD